MRPAILTLLTGILLMSMQPAPAIAAQTIDVPGASQTVVYKKIGDVELRMFIFNPPNHQPTDKTPAIVFFFGGGWVQGEPKQFAPHCAYFASRGMVAITADYRVRSRQHTTPFECVKDAKSAIRYVRAHAAELGVDPDRIVAAGGSAGGHIAACTGVLDGNEEATDDLTVSSKANALVLFNPALLLGPIEGKLDLPPERMAKLADRFGKDSPASISPYHALSADDPPTIIFHGRADTTVPVESVELYAEKAKELKLRCELVTYPDAGHGFFNYGRDGNSAFLATTQAADEFLISLGYLQGKPTIGEFKWTAAPK